MNRGDLLNKGDNRLYGAVLFQDEAIFSPREYRAERKCGHAGMKVSSCSSDSVNNAGQAVLTRPQKNHTKGRDARDDGREANDPRDDLRSPENLFRSNDHRDDNHHERIHNAQSELDRHRRRAAETTGHTLFAAKLKTGFVFGA